MDIMELGALGEFLGSFGVVATLVYLALQIRQNTRATRSQTAQGTFQLSFDVVNSVVTGGNVSLWIRFQTDGLDNLSEEDAQAASILARAVITSYDNHHYQYRRGNLDEEIHLAYKNRLIGLLSRPGLRAWVSDNREFFTVSFQEQLDELILQTPISHDWRVALQRDD